MHAIDPCKESAAHLLATAFKRPSTRKGAPVAAATLETIGLELVITPNPDGEVESVIPVSWTINEALIERLREAEFMEPHIVFVVASVSRGGSDNYMNFYYEVRKVYHMPLEAKTPKQYVQFGRAGENIVGAFIVDMADNNTKRVVANCVRSSRAYLPASLVYAFETSMAATLPEDLSMRVRTFEKDVEKSTAREFDETDPNIEWEKQFGSREAIFQRAYDGAEDEVRMDGNDIAILAPVFRRVMVPEEFFAKEPPAWARELVWMFYSDARGVDKCDFRKRFLISLGISIPVQIYGVFARLFTLIYALFMAKRGMNLRMLFALRPHDFAESIKGHDSFWFRKKDGGKRTVLPWVSPPFLLIYGVILAVGSLVVLALGVGVTWILDLLISGPVVVTGASIIATGVISLVILGVIVFLFWLNFNRKGRFLRREIAKRIAAVLPEKKATLEAAPVAVAEVPSKLHLELLAAARRGAGITSAEEIKDDTVQLVFHKIRRAVCQPFSR